MNGSRLWPVSISTLTLIPERNRRVSSSLSKAILTGTRCTIFTQFPVAFCGGSMENCAPVPGLTGDHGAGKGMVGETVDIERDFLPDTQIGDVGFLRIGVDPWRLIVDDAENRGAGRDKPAELDVIHLRCGTRHWRADDRVIEVALCVVERGFGLRIFRELRERQIGIVEQLVQRRLTLLGGIFRL